jgi:hypothetical protein
MKECGAGRRINFSMDNTRKRQESHLSAPDYVSR